MSFFVLVLVIVIVIEHDYDDDYEHEHEHKRGVRLHLRRFKTRAREAPERTSMPAQKHNFTATEIKAGALVLVAAVVFAVFVAVVNGLRPPQEVKRYVAYFADTAGLNKNADVRFGGTKVGRVAEIRLDPEHPSGVGDDPEDKNVKLCVVAEVRADVPVNAKSEAYITQVSLTAEKHLEISTGKSGEKPLEDGAAITPRAGGLFDQADKLARTVQDMLGEVRTLFGVDEAKEKEKETGKKMATIASIFDTVESTVSGGSDLVGDIRKVIADNEGDISAILDKVQEVEDSAKKLVDQIDGILAENRSNLQGTIENVHGIVADVRPLVQRAAALSERLDAMADALQATLDNAVKLSGHAADMIENQRPAIEDMILDLRETVRNLKTFSRTMAEQPQAVLQGKSPEGRK